MAFRHNGRQRLRLVVAVIAAVLAAFGPALVGPASPASADPDVNEGGSKSLGDKLEAAAKAYYDIRAKLSASQKRQVEIQKQLREAEVSLVRLNAEVGKIAAGRYKGSQLGVLNGLFTGTGSRESLLQAAAIADYMVWRDDDQLRQLVSTKDQASRLDQLLKAEVANEQTQLAQLDKAKRAAEKALASVGGMVSAGYGGPAVAAQAAKRNADGSFPRESCSIKDPTNTGGCLKPRMFHALNEARLAGFTHYVRCWRTQAWGEHPLGQACDFAADKSGFGGVATGSAKTYGNRLAAWCKANAEALGVMYVIWFRQIWMPGIGWRYYSGSGGDPSSNHENHVHLSIL
jgi:hypothetical protein